MTVLAANVPHETDLGFVDVENRLAPGRYRFRLTVSDDSKNESEATFLLVTVSEVQREPPVVIDRGVIDRGVIDRGIIDRGVIDRGVIDRGVIDRGVIDRGTIDRGTIDRGAIDRKVIDRVVLNPGIGEVVRPIRPIFPRKPTG